MVGLGAVEAPEAHGRGAVYRVAADLHERRAFLERRLPALRQFFTQKAELQNADFRALFAVIREMALREITRLVELGFLESRGERRGAHYLPGPAFPDRRL